jgi:hypothetical protein
VHSVLANAAGMRAFTTHGAEIIKAADIAATDMANAADMRGAKAGDRTNADATNVSTAAKAANVSATAEAAAHSASVTAAAASAPRIGLRNRQARSQQGRRQNRHHFSHRLLHSGYWNGAHHFKVARTEASDEMEIGILLRTTIKMTFRQFTPPSRRCAL